MWFWVSEPLGIYAIGLFDFDGWDGVHRVKNNNNNILKFLDSMFYFLFFKVFLKIAYSQDIHVSSS